MEPSRRARSPPAGRGGGAAAPPAGRGAGPQPRGWAAGAPVGGCVPGSPGCSVFAGVPSPRAPRPLPITSRPLRSSVPVRLLFLHSSGVADGRRSAAAPGKSPAIPDLSFEFHPRVTACSSLLTSSLSRLPVFTKYHMVYHETTRHNTTPRSQSRVTRGTDARPPGAT